MIFQCSVTNASRSIGYRLRRVCSPTASARSASSLHPSGGEGAVSSEENNSKESGTFSAPDLFPWRHELLPLPRLIPGTPEHKEVGLLLTSRSQKVYGNSSLNAIATAYMFLNVPWYELFWISHFQDELTSDMSWCFTNGVSSLLSNLPTHGGGDPIPSDRIITEENDGTCRIDFCETIEISRSAGNEAYRITVLNDEDQNNDDGSSSYGESNANRLRQMFHEKVVELYQSSIDKVAGKTDDSISDNTVETKRRLEVRLRMTPYDSKFITLYAIPYLSRRNSKNEPTLLRVYREMLNSPSSGRATYLSQLRQEHLEKRGNMESTIIAQCLVWCDELFYVKDLGTGEILQGKEEDQGSSSSDTMTSQRIPHLVRMERTVITKRDPTTGMFENEQQNWIITDIDDLLGGNLLV